MNDIRQKVLKAILTDDSAKTSDNVRIINMYNSNPEAKQVVDGIFISLCGFSLQTIIDQEESEED
jgi:hypothetical protein